MKLKIQVIARNDLAVDFHCDCPHPRFIGTPVEHIMKNKITLYGYNDRYFFEEVNKEPRNIKCRCGKEYTQQWFDKGYVIVEPLAKEESA